MRRAKTISFFTLGCRSNQAETVILRNVFENDGYKIVDFKKPAKIVVINTCTVTQNSDTDVRRAVNRARKVNPDCNIALIGCQAQTQKEKLLDLKNVTWVVGNERKMDLLNILSGSLPKKSKIISPEIKRKSFILPAAGIDQQRTRANIKIQDGCDSFCAYCEVPYARGPARSRSFKDIIKEAQILVEAKHQELILTGIHLGTYQYRKKTLIDVIKELTKIEGLKRIRISSIEPTHTMPVELLQLMKTNEKLCRFLHVPIQHGHDEILKMMGRKYKAKDFLKFINKAASLIPDICIGTDVIVGFPGETDEHFNETYQFLKEAPVNYFHVFSYSERKLARSKDFPNQVPIFKTQERSKKLRDLGQNKREQFYKSQINKTYDVLYEQKKTGQWKGLTDNYIQVSVQSPENLKNKFFETKMMEVKGQEVFGKITSVDKANLI